MGIQYVTVKVDTSGLYQPVSAPVGIVGIIGQAPSAGAGFNNPFPFTRPLTGIDGEPYARVVPVLRVATAAGNAPLGPDGNPIANVAWQQPKDSKGNATGPLQLADSSATTFSPLTVDLATRTLRRSNNAVFQAGSGPAQVVIDYFSIADKTVSGTATFWGAALDISGQPVANLLMKPDAAPGLRLHRCDRSRAQDRRHARQGKRWHRQAQNRQRHHLLPAVLRHMSACEIHQSGADQRRATSLGLSTGSGRDIR